MVLAQTLDNIKARAAFREVSDGVCIIGGILTLDVHSARQVIWLDGSRSGRRGTSIREIVKVIIAVYLFL
jgi:hypothetical protein